ncbi:hypothetical protein VCR20J5_130033 [Vibrio crassostreae]|uniref:Uncharacterized protein n=1 Tax=Vibrio crassostreae TaxID=246167 RepID=A0A822MY66_9VIBR|nr:hypothetical protein VCR15J5_120062 [Vibrio crassostreae]CDT14607.1 hypothetical protein VCR5J5_1510061 [Vibrio crassostreae]CDT15379.1 hypothetical protein VCR20J5_130033 [Vibrio crassostreae]
MSNFTKIGWIIVRRSNDRFESDLLGAWPELSPIKRASKNSLFLVR